MMYLIAFKFIIMNISNNYGFKGPNTILAQSDFLHLFSCLIWCKNPCLYVNL